jgi:hypothetical protein
MSSVISELSTISSILFNQMESYPVVSLLTTMTKKKKSPALAKVPQWLQSDLMAIKRGRPALPLTDGATHYGKHSGQYIGVKIKYRRRYTSP